jgi:hypothetical protein
VLAAAFELPFGEQWLVGKVVRIFIRLDELSSATMTPLPERRFFKSEIHQVQDQKNAS